MASRAYTQTLKRGAKNVQVHSKQVVVRDEDKEEDVSHNYHSKCVVGFEFVGDDTN